MKARVFSEKINSLVLAGVLSVLSLGSVNGFAATVSADGMLDVGLPGITPPSLPAFFETVKVTYDKSGPNRVLKATYNSDHGVSLLINRPGDVFTIKDTKYTLNANFNSSNVFQGGTVKIDGKISGLGINSVETLMTANLTDFAKGFGNYVLGFDTSNIVCNPKVDAYVHCTKNEAVYLGLNKPFNFKTGYSATGVALTSVPIPVAAWLFGSGLVGLVGIARRRTAISV